MTDPVLNKPKNQLEPSLLRERLQREFVTYHQRRRIARTVVPLVLVLILAGAGSWLGVKRYGSGQGSLADKSHREVNVRPANTLPGSSHPIANSSSESTESSTPNVSRPPQSFTSIDVHLMSDDELQEALNELPDGWIIVSVDGQLTAIHEDELKPSRRRFVRTGNGRPPRPSSAGQGRWEEPSPHPRLRTSG
jgi:hypothetical protein